MLDSLALTLSDLRKQSGLIVCHSLLPRSRILFFGFRAEPNCAGNDHSFCTTGYIPSPTFTLVQPYLSNADFGSGIWISIALKHQNKLALGIEDAFYACCCLIEWPDKLRNGCRLTRSN